MAIDEHPVAHVPRHVYVFLPVERVWLALSRLHVDRYELVADLRHHLCVVN